MLQQTTLKDSVRPFGSSKSRKASFAQRQIVRDSREAIQTERSRVLKHAATSRSWRKSSRPMTSQVGACTCEDYQTYTNREGKVLSEIAENVWGAERPFKWFGIDVNGRMAVIRLKDGSLWVHSPVGLDERLKAALAKLGPVKHVVSPNFEHTKFAKQWQEAYPEAKLYACPGLPAKTDTKYDEELSATSTSRPEWGEEMQYTCLSYERNPFTGKPFFNEVVFLHKPSKFFMATDLFWNYPSKGTNLPTQAWKFGMDRIFAPFYRKFMVAQKDEFQQVADRIIDVWDFDGIIPCHGDVVFSGAKGLIKQQLLGPRAVQASA